MIHVYAIKLTIISFILMLFMAIVGGALTEVLDEKGCLFFIVTIITSVVVMLLSFFVFIWTM